MVLYHYTSNKYDNEPSIGAGGKETLPSVANGKVQYYFLFEGKFVSIFLLEPVDQGAVVRDQWNSQALCRCQGRRYDPRKKT
jgi:hypothetical protein